MGEKIDERIVKVGLLALGIWLLYEFLKSHGKDVTIYRCPHCNFILREKYLSCPKCGTRLLWKNPTDEGMPPILEKLSTKPWWVGVIILIVSVAMLVICTLCKVANPAMIEIWKALTFICIGYVVGEPIGAATGIKRKK